MTLIAPKWGEAFVDKTGVPGRRPQRWIDEVSRIVNTNENNSTPTYPEVGTGDSPYQLLDNQFITVDMSGGDFVVILPSESSFGVGISREGAENSLTIQGTVNGEVDPEILFDDTGIRLFKNDTEWRYI